MKPKNNIIDNNNLNLDILLESAKKPALFESGEALFWNDPHISGQMLQYHLNPDNDIASRRHVTIDRIVEWLCDYLKLDSDNRVLEIGCGPGLYTSRFAKRGLSVTGMDYSRNSLNYAQEYAENNGLDIRYIYQNYLTLDSCEEYDAIFLICCDFGALTDVDRDLLLGKVRRALKPGGVFAFDVYTREQREQPESVSWQMCEAGFWRPYPHLVLEQTFCYEEQNVFLNQYNVIESNGQSTLYRIWDHCYTPDALTELIQNYGYLVEAVFGDLAGTPFTDGSKTLGMVARKCQSN